MKNVTKKWNVGSKKGSQVEFRAFHCPSRGNLVHGDDKQLKTQILTEKITAQPTMIDSVKLAFVKAKTCPLMKNKKTFKVAQEPKNFTLMEIKVTHNGEQVKHNFSFLLCSLLPPCPLFLLWYFDMLVQLFLSLLAKIVVAVGIISVSLCPSCKANIRRNN